MYGLKDKDIELINSVFKRHDKIERVILYGSRAKGNYRPNSDIDLTLIGKDLTLKEQFEIENELDDLMLPYKIDLSIYQKIENQDLTDHIDRVGIVFFENNFKKWSKKELNQVAELVKESWKVGDEELPYIGLEHIVENELRINGIGSSVDVVSNKYYFDDDTFLFGKLRPYFRKLCRPEFKGICSTDIWVVKPKEDNDKDFLFYLFANQEFVDMAYSSSSGTRMPRADWNFMGSTKWDFPEYEEQLAISKILLSLDDKIKLLHNQNKTLEDMAETLFRKWFVEELDENWEISNIGKELKTVLGGTPSTKKLEYWGGKIPWINSGEVNKFRILKGTKFITDLGLRKSNTKLLPKGTTVLAITGATLGQTSMLEIDTCANQSVVGVIPNEKFPKEFVYLWIKLKIEEIILNETGGAQPHINKNDVNQTDIIVPEREYMQKAMNVISPLFQKISTNCFQIETLKNQRDTLLPKLMSGEVRVKV